MTPANAALGAQDIHLYFACDGEITDQDLLARYGSLLNADEQQQQQRFHFAKHRHQYLVTRALVRTILSRYVNAIAPPQWVFSRNQYGKPAIANSLAQPLYFNISHTCLLYTSPSPRDS